MRYFPQVVDRIKKIKVISARSTYEHVFPGDSHQWKIQAFLSTMNELELGAVTNLICLGDSNIEMDAG